MLETIAIYLAAAVLAVPVANRLGLGSVLGYIFAGVLIGPFLLGLVGDQTQVQHFAEFGVVMMLFLVGLELQPSKLWQLKGAVFGLGGLQVLLTTALIFAIAVLALSLSWQAALALGLMLSLSSTAIVLQTLAEKGWIKQPAGQNSFAVLLFQDIAVIPMLALLPLLSTADAVDPGHSDSSLIAHLPLYGQIIISVAVIIGIIVAGKHISAPLFRYIAATRLREVFTVFGLLLVVAIALLMQAVGLSPALGTFLAGVVLAESEFRHELEADIEPFKGLLLGLFFITVGASINFALLEAQLLPVIGLVLLLILVKMAVLAFLARVFRMQQSQGVLFTLALAQGGEFAFVLAALSGSLNILSTEQMQLAALVVTLSMICAPLLLIAYQRWQTKVQNRATEREFDAIEPTQHVIIAGYGRFGQIVGRLLTAQGYHMTVLDHSADQIDVLRRFGNKAYYGDAARLDLLHAAGASDAQLLVIAIDAPDKTLEIVELAHKHFPKLRIAARAIDRRHAYQLLRLGVEHFKRETFDSAVNLGVDALKLLGNSEESAEKAGTLFRAHDNASLKILADVCGDDASYGVAIRQRTEDLKQVLMKDKEQQSKLKCSDAPEVCQSTPANEIR
ncbi:MAG: potassium transporter [Alteromonadaceae bacterium]|nr:potassium transporter [Alteromonadaceae bacterium]